MGSGESSSKQNPTNTTKPDFYNNQNPAYNTGIANNPVTQPNNTRPPGNYGPRPPGPPGNYGPRPSEPSGNYGPRPPGPPGNYGPGPQGNYGPRPPGPPGNYGPRPPGPPGNYGPRPPGPSGNYGPEQFRPYMPSQQTTDRNAISPIQTKPVLLVPSDEQTFSVVNKRPPTPLGENQSTNSSTYSPTMPQPNIVTANSLQRAPKIQAICRVPSSENKLMEAYGHHDITVMQINSRHDGTLGYRWYDHVHKNNNVESKNF